MFFVVHFLTICTVSGCSSPLGQWRSLEFLLNTLLLTTYFLKSATVSSSDRTARPVLHFPHPYPLALSLVLLVIALTLLFLVFQAQAPILTDRIQSPSQINPDHSPPGDPRAVQPIQPDDPSRQRDRPREDYEADLGYQAAVGLDVQPVKDGEVAEDDLRRDEAKGEVE